MMKKMKDAAVDYLVTRSFTWWLLVISFVFFCFYEASEDYIWTWTLWPPFRLILHAVAAVIGAIFLSWISLIWAEINRILIGVWIIYVSRIFRMRSKTIRRLKRINSYFFRFLQPVVGAGIYILRSYAWETYQVDFHNRTFQTGQFVVDIIFAIVGAGIWFYVYQKYTIGNNYYLSNREWLEGLREVILPDRFKIYCEYYEHGEVYYVENSKITVIGKIWMVTVIILLLLIPLIVVLTNWLLVVLYLSHWF